MSREQQIEGLSKDIFEHCSAGLFEDEVKEIARFVIEGQGYRKADELIAENEQLRERQASYDKQIRADARREFAEQLKNYYIKNFNSLKGSINCDLVAYHIDQILADMERKDEQ